MLMCPGSATMLRTCRSNKITDEVRIQIQVHVFDPEHELFP